MRCLERNKKCFYYALFDSKDPVKDEDGNFTGEYTMNYKVPVHMKANISPVIGEAQADLFGSDVDYDRVIVVDEPCCPIDEYSVLCIETPPDYDEEGNLIYDYIVKKVARSINSVSYAVSKVKVS